LADPAPLSALVTGGAGFALAGEPIKDISIGDLARLIKEMTQSPSPIVFVPYDEACAKDFEDMRLLARIIEEFRARGR
jgi:hypothetical protein